MPAGLRGNQRWEIKNGKPVITTPAVAAQSEEIPVARLDRQIERISRRKEQAAESLAVAQKEFDDLEAFETELKALRAQIP
jgi:hypothetical protein